MRHFCFVIVHEWAGKRQSNAFATNAQAFSRDIALARGTIPFGNSRSLSSGLVNNMHSIFENMSMKSAKDTLHPALTNGWAGVVLCKHARVRRTPKLTSRSQSFANTVQSLQRF